MGEELVLVTGAAGKLAGMLRPRLATPERRLRLLDINSPKPPGPGENVEIATGSITDWDTITAACRRVDAVLHLGGTSVEAPWHEILDANIHGTRQVLEAARTVGVRRVILASSNHAAGFYTRRDAGDKPLPAETAPRPDTYYGVSKAATEALGSLYHSRFGLDIICLRIGHVIPFPERRADLFRWLSPDDAVRLVHACLTADSPGFRVVWGISRNSRGWWSLAEGEAIGYYPVDDAERWADTVQLDAGDSGPDDHLGADFCAVPLGESMRGANRT